MEHMNKVKNFMEFLKTNEKSRRYAYSNIKQCKKNDVRTEKNSGKNGLT
jgi:hypothetical protein